MSYSNKNSLYRYSSCKITKVSKGFTLVELMVVVVIIAIFAAIAIPSYRAYVVRSAEADVRKKMLSLSAELEQWRAKALTYNGFEPKPDASAPTLPIIDTSGKINFPTNNSNPNYIISLGQLDAAGTTFSILTASGSTGTNWVMMASPTSHIKGANYYRIDSMGRKCANNIAFTIDEVDCGAGGKSW